MHKFALLGLCAIGFALNANSSQANGYGEGPWCARFSGGNDFIENCSMRSFAMCLTEIRGTGGNALCSPNPRMWVQEPAKPRHSTARPQALEGLPAAKRLK